jgi:hypothetical protein
MSVIRGSIGGVTYSANTFCAIIARARTVPVNTNTTYQQMIRSCFTQAKAIWPTLTRAQRNGWDVWADTVHLTGPTGPYTVPGRQWYQGIRGLVYYLALRGVTFGTASHNPPTISGLISTPVWTTEAPATGAGYIITLTPVTTELLTAYTSRSPAFTDDRNFYQGPWLPETLLSETQTLVADPIELERTDLVAGSVYFERLRLVTKQGPFRVSAEIILRITALTAADLGTIRSTAVTTKGRLSKAS